jgi:hypothetical protein
MQAGGKTIHSENLDLFARRNEWFIIGLFVYTAIELIVVINNHGGVSLVPTA